jgi:hypothetical protein
LLLLLSWKRLFWLRLGFMETFSPPPPSPFYKLFSDDFTVAIVRELC